VGTWSDFCRELEKAGAFLDRPESPLDEIDRAEGLRYLTRLLRVGLDLTLEFADPHHPALISAQESHFGDGGNTADCVYLHAVIDGRLRYRLHGTRGDAPLVEIGLYDGKIGLNLASKRVDALTEAELVVDERGEIDVLIGPDLSDDEGSNVLRSDTTTRYLFIRQYAHDWDVTTRAALSLELVNPEPVAQPLLTLAGVGEALGRAARFVHDAAIAWAAVVDNARRGPANVLTPVPDGIDMTVPTGHRYAFGHFDLAEDEALVIEFTPSAVPYWGLAINNYWFEVPDYEGVRGQVNNHTVQYDGGGTARVVVSARDPDVPNWIDTFGHRVGVMVFRWFRTALPMPELRTRVVPVASLAGCPPQD
jgi:hypothetical protein